MSDQNITEYYQGSEGDAYFRARDQATIRTLGHRLQAEFFRSHLSFGDQVLDFGCGNGSMASILSEDVARVDGIEVNVHPRSIAREMLGLTVYERIDALPSNQSYDVIYANHVLEHLPAPSQALRALRPHLRPDGTLLIMVPHEDIRTARNRDWQTPDDNKHLHSWTPLQLANTLRLAGFEPLDVRVVTSAWTPHAFFLGSGLAQKLFGTVFAHLKRRRQVFAVARVSAS